MKEFIEKLNGRLEEEKERANRHYNYGDETAYRHSIEIVNELAEEYKDNVIIDGQYCWQTCGATEHCKECNRLGNGSIDYFENYDFMVEEHNGGWIPCSERLPETNESVLCWAKSTARGGDVCFVGSCHNDFWFLQSSADTHSFPGQYVIVAWQPLPEPYKEK